MAHLAFTRQSVRYPMTLMHVGKFNARINSTVLQVRWKNSWRRNYSNGCMHAGLRSSGRSRQVVNNKVETLQLAAEWDDPGAEAEEISKISRWSYDGPPLGRSAPPRGADERPGGENGARKPLLMHARHRAHCCHQNLQSLRLSQDLEQLLSEIMNKMFSFTSAKDFIELSPLFFLRILEGLWDFVLVTRFEKHFASDKVKNFMH